MSLPLRRIFTTNYISYFNSQTHKSQQLTLSDVALFSVPALRLDTMYNRNHITWSGSVSNVPVCRAYHQSQWLHPSVMCLTLQISSQTARLSAAQTDSAHHITPTQLLHTSQRLHSMLNIHNVGYCDWRSIPQLGSVSVCHAPWLNGSRYCLDWRFHGTLY